MYKFSKLIAARTNVRIISGDNASIKNFPWQVSIRKNIGQHICGGALISTTKILTAANCLHETTAANIHVVTGSDSLAQGGEYHDVSSFILHEKYVKSSSSEYSSRYNIALITLSTPAKVSDKQSPVVIANEVIKNNTQAVISGWGLFFHQSNAMSTILQTSNFTILSNDDCQRYHTITIYDDHLCTLGSIEQGLCDGDGGSALVVDDKIVGISSSFERCTSYYPVVYTRVSSYYDWIIENTEDDSV